MQCKWYFWLDVSKLISLEIFCVVIVLTSYSSRDSNSFRLSWTAAEAAGPKQRIYFLLVFCIRMKSPFYLMLCKSWKKLSLRHNGHFFVELNIIIEASVAFGTLLCEDLFNIEDFLSFWCLFRAFLNYFSSLKRQWFVWKMVFYVSHNWDTSKTSLVIRKFNFFSMHTSPIPSFKSMIHHFNFVPSEKYVKKRCQTNFVSKEKLIEIILANLQTNFQKQNMKEK